MVIVLLISVLLYIADSQINDFKGQVNSFLQQFNIPFVLILFFVTQSILGLIPPDFFIVWSGTTSHPFLVLTALAAISYTGALISYWIGHLLISFPRIHLFIKNKYSSHFATLHRYGGFLIFFSAILPIPFSVVTLVAGMLEFPFKRTAILGLARFIRFFSYALVLYRVF